jgi:DNA modification methylase
MAHFSEQCKRLRLIEPALREYTDFARIPTGDSDVYLLQLPFEPTISYVPEDGFIDAIKSFLQRLGQNAVVCILTSPVFAAEIWPQIETCIHFKLWLSVKLDVSFPDNPILAPSHATVLVATKYRQALRHTKTRVAYTYCPACNKTTKDYGGKKHTYHEYGTLISDIWRDISCDPKTRPEEIIDRLRDLFGLDSHRTLYYIDCKAFFKPSQQFAIPSAEYKKSSSAPANPGLFRGDCLDLLSRIPSEGIDFCFADPPYNLEKKYDTWNDSLDIQKYFSWCDLWLSELMRVLKPGRTAAVLNIPLWAIRHFSFLKTIASFQSWIVWEGLSLPVRMIMPSNYAILCFSKGAPRLLPEPTQAESSVEDKNCLLTAKEGFCFRPDCTHYRKLSGIPDKEPISDLWWDIHRLKHNSRRADHPCQLPPSLMRRLIALFAQPGEIVLDPFNGVGTTSLCAQETGRSYIGIEISEKYHAIAQNRHKELSSGVDPFRKTTSVPKIKNNYVRRIEKQKYVVSKKELQLDVRRISHELGRIPLRNEVEIFGKYPIQYYDEYFLNWSAVCAAARTTGMSENRKIFPGSFKDKQLTLF